MTDVDEYLRELRRELAGLPRAQRDEVVGEIEAHIAEARAEAPDEDVRTILDRLGDPAAIADAARDRFGLPQRRRAGFVEVCALVLLLVGGLVIPVIGWFVGVVLLWVSDAWSARDKLIGTLVVPGGLLLPGFLLASVAFSESCHAIVDSHGVGTSSCSGGLGPIEQIVIDAGFALLLLAPLATTVYLARRIGRANRFVT